MNTYFSNGRKPPIPLMCMCLFYTISNDPDGEAKVDFSNNFKTFHVSFSFKQ